MKLMLQALIKYLAGVVLLGALLFLPAWTFSYPGAWLFLALLFIPMLIMGAVLLIKAPALLERLEKLSQETGIKFTLTLSLAEEDACDCIKKYL